MDGLLTLRRFQRHPHSHQRMAFPHLLPCHVSQLFYYRCRCQPRYPCSLMGSLERLGFCSALVGPVCGGNPPLHSCLHSNRTLLISLLRSVGHEIVGTVVRAGSKSGHEVGTRVGVGAQAGSCSECSLCERSREQYCEKGMIGTYQGKVRLPPVSSSPSVEADSRLTLCSGPMEPSDKVDMLTFSAHLGVSLSLCRKV